MDPIHVQLWTVQYCVYLRLPMRRSDDGRCMLPTAFMIPLVTRAVCRRNLRSPLTAFSSPSTCRAQLTCTRYGDSTIQRRRNNFKLSLYSSGLGVIVILIDKSIELFLLRLYNKQKARTFLQLSTVRRRKTLK